MSRLILISLFLFSMLHPVSAQSDLEGSWVGTYKVFGKHYPTEIEITQNGNILEAVATNIIKDTVTVKYRGKGLVRGNGVIIKFDEWIKKEGGTCLSTHRLKLLKHGDELQLVGKWGHNLVKDGCLIGTGGALSLVKSAEQESFILADARTLPNTDVQVEDQELDIFYEELVKELNKRTYHALLIAVDDYPSKDIPDLDQPSKDINLLENTLVSKYSFKGQNIYKLINPTRNDIIERLDQLSDQLGQNDNLLIFYAGHGVWDEDLEQGYWLPSNAKMTSKSSWISNGTIRDYIRGIDTQHTLLIADACFSGGIFKDRSAQLEGRALVELYRMPSRKAMTSGTLTTVPDKSVFVKYLVKNLEMNSDPVISADEIFYNLKVAVINNSPNQQVPQYGVVHQSGDEGGDFLFLRRQE